MDLQLAGRRAIVTGGSRGIGLAVARTLIAEGVHVALVARGREALGVAAAALSHCGPSVTAINADSTDDHQVRDAVAQVVTTLGGVDILVNSAASPGSSSPRRHLQELLDDDIRTEVETKVLGYLRFARAVAPDMASRGWGRIINISGLGARTTGNIAGSIRNVSVAALTKNLADELGPSGINVTVVHPGATVTEAIAKTLQASAAANGITADEAAARMASQVSIGRLVTAAEVADVVTFLASPRSVAINGDAVAAGGGARGVIHY
jgi:NAD(P)-dependent dehydrogenase (short-subunit alcohol dehydrogenase family)